MELTVSHDVHDVSKYWLRLCFANIPLDCQQVSKLLKNRFELSILALDYTKIEDVQNLAGKSPTLVVET